MTDIEKLRGMHAQGACCSQVMVYMGLEWLGEHNPQMVQATGGLCAGMRCGLTCGALTGGIMMLGLFDSSLAYSVMIPELVEWFVDKYGVDGNVNCGHLRDQTEATRYEECPKLMESTYLKAKEILLENGFEPVSQLDVGLEEPDWLLEEDWDDLDNLDGLEIFTVDGLLLE